MKLPTVFDPEIATGAIYRRSYPTFEVPLKARERRLGKRSPVIDSEQVKLQNYGRMGDQNFALIPVRNPDHPRFFKGWPKDDGPLKSRGKALHNQKLEDPFRFIKVINGRFDLSYAWVIQR